jgi:hypothetical protein
MTLSDIHASAGQRILYLRHAVIQMSRGDRMITTDDVESVIFRGEIIEQYPNDLRGRSCLMLGFDMNQSPVHIVCAPRSEYLAVITAYRPDSSKWDKTFRTRT